MNLSFRTTFPEELEIIGGKPTHFVNQIAASLKIVTGDYLPAEYCPPDFNVVEEMGNGIKHHTIRQDKKNSWKAGNDIHFIINNRTPKRFQFAPIVPCVSTQIIAIYHNIDKSDFQIADPSVHVDNRNLKSLEIRRLAINDGFTSVVEFFAYFHKDFTGKIIHWTNLNY